MVISDRTYTIEEFDKDSKLSGAGVLPGFEVTVSDIFDV